MAQSTEDGKTFVCMVWDNDPQKFSNPLQLEIYRNQQLVVTSPVPRFASGISGKTESNYLFTLAYKAMLAPTGYSMQQQGSQ